MTKENAGVFIVWMDIVSVIVALYFFRRLNLINEEYLETLDNNIVLMSKFTVQINNL